MTSQKLSSFAAVFNFLIAAFLIITEFTGKPLLSVLGADPLLILSFCIAMSMFCSELTSAISGLIIGIFVDSASSGPAFFNTFFFMLICLAVSLTVHYYFNNNIRAAMALILICSILYFGIKWVFGHAFNGVINDSLQILLKNALPSALFTSVFIIPFYYLERAIFSKAS